MKSLFKYAAMAVLATVSCSLASCSDDDNDDPKRPDAPVIDQVFPEGVPSQIGDTKIVRNSNGQVTKIETKDESYTSTAEFEYGTFSRATEFQVKLTQYDSYDPTDKTVIYMQLNDKGFVKYALEVYSDPEYSDDEWWFEYNADGQLNYLKRTEGDNEVTRITYTNGDITSRATTSDDHQTPSIYNISYTDNNVKRPIANKGGIMLFDDLFQIDMDEMEVAYYAGLLGKATKNLPVRQQYAGSDNDGEYTSIEWTLNANGLPTLLNIKEVNPWGGYDEQISFVW